MKSVRPGHEGMWSPVLATFIFVAALGLSSMIGIGVWRFKNQESARRHNNNLINELNTKIDDLINFVEKIKVPTNCSFDITNITQPTHFSDNEFRIFGALDSTQTMAFNASGIPGTTLRVLSLQNVSGTVAYLSDVLGQSSTFLDNAFAVQRFDSTTRQVMFDLSGISNGVTRMLSIQDASGTIAYLTDIPLQPSVFLDNAFGVVNFIDGSKQVMLNCTGINDFTTRVMTVQDANGTIAYLSDIAGGLLPPFSDDVFSVYLAGTPSARTQLEVGGLSANTTVIMSIQDASGIIAYLADILQIIEVTVNVSRIFPDVGNEGVSTLAELGALSHIEVTFCGGGGGGGGQGGDGGEGAGGGAGSAIVDFLILEPSLKFTAFNVSLGVGGLGGNAGGNDGTSGTPTSVVGQSVTGFHFDLTAYGGGGADGGDNNPFFGGAGGGGGGSATLDVAGIAGPFGGLVGGLANTFTTFPERGPFKAPWWSGGAGGGDRSGIPGGSPGTSWQGGFNAHQFFFTGAASLFAPSLIPTQPRMKTGSCAGGSHGLANGFGDDGGDGLAVFRYFIL